jgi:hypothetical protein
MKFLLIILGILLMYDKVFATAQFPDILIDGKDTVAIFSNPLEQYFEKKKERILCGEILEWTSTACYRGYQATWRIKNDSLFLIEIRHGCGEIHGKKFNLKKEFGTRNVFANWFTGNIYSPRGELLQYVHDGYASIFENEKYIFIHQGQVDSIAFISNLIFDKNLLYPAEGFLSDTLRRRILSNLDKDKVKEFPDSLVCSLNIRFNKSGIIDSISNEFTYDGINPMEDYIYQVALNSLKGLPALMKVTHKRYYPPLISIFFDAHCVKNPLDKKYGCRN